MDPDLEKLAAMARPLTDKQLPNVFLGELQEFNWALEQCVFSDGRPGIRFVIMPALLPFIKFSLPFQLPGLEKLYADIAYALEEFQTTNATET